MRDTIPVRISRERHAQIQKFAEDNKVSISLVIDLACKRLLSSGVDLRALLLRAEDAYDRMIDKLMAEPVKSVQPTTTTAEVDEIVESLNSVITPAPTVDISRIFDGEEEV
jgi:hypothetical protein